MPAALTSAAGHLAVTRQCRWPDAYLPLEHMYDAGVKCALLEHAFAYGELATLGPAPGRTRPGRSWPASVPWPVGSPVASRSYG